ncbi:hypothetical protein BC941DRAFT_166578 [Chlamydoabsidia padenii]|nr:hypothetical protein BC941DRAFT_166578 [Chlamydoabsidia padenii]
MLTTGQHFSQTAYEGNANHWTGLFTSAYGGYVNHWTAIFTSAYEGNLNHWTGLFTSASKGMLTTGQHFSQTAYEGNANHWTGLFTSAYGGNANHWTAIFRKLPRRELKPQGNRKMDQTTKEEKEERSRIKRRNCLLFMLSSYFSNPDPGP